MVMAPLPLQETVENPAANSPHLQYLAIPQAQRSICWIRRREHDLAFGITNERLHNKLGTDHCHYHIPWLGLARFIDHQDIAIKNSHLPHRVAPGAQKKNRRRRPNTHELIEG